MTITDEEVREIPGGTFLMGSPQWVLDWLQEEGQAFDTEWFADEGPQVRVEVKPFAIDRYPVTVRRFQRFTDETGYRTDAETRGWGVLYTNRYWEQVGGAYWRQPGGAGTTVDGRLDHPVVHISWNDATAYARWAGLRLPTEAEWELAARGVEYRLWPWGDEWEPDRANCADYHVGAHLLKLSSWRDWWLQVCAKEGPMPQTTPVGAFPGGDSTFGVSDLTGNVYEWTSSLCALFGDPADYDPMYRMANGRFRAVRGGSWMNFRYQLRCSERIYADPDGWSNFAMGFRCARDL
ncbi:Sulphatase-modifying factor protein [Saccharothrix sp. ALI-22-I]|uniref:formylglycine-generating enzyme family protein n=1 Tax=Saccharothrix sp. ALI-22-I TaxID=1933778 RepID=UPI00097BC7FF|nr:formylglycine-generating enzyme family protein [Saccharothrix sp. ALI-22-I]ONI91585.1 Sulphatase-modifying factor protein [Saccharothrix sp. ALI-22-I]